MNMPTGASGSSQSRTKLRDPSGAPLRMGSMSNTTRYGVLIDGRRGGYGVVFPDLPGCTAMGRTLDEALRHDMEAGRRMGASCLCSRARDCWRHCATIVA